MNKTVAEYLKKCFAFLILSLTFMHSGHAQTSKVDSFFTDTPIFIQGSFHTGKVIPTNDFVRGQNFSGDTIDEYKSFSLLLLKQTTGNKLWEQLYGYPVYGVGIYS
ncbi:MAG TPA: hypothetical protein VKA38_13695, partial [Draconibacterium sp.]|nr:hypothetical protein [Draconibacterium sp.]